MKKISYIIYILFLSTGLFFSCRGGTHKNNDHDYDGINENDDRTSTNQVKTDSSQQDTVNRYPIDANRQRDSIENPTQKKFRNKQ
jgi:hypothetical protein